jgi:subfamily B ATP-binding cassette protein MsbA
MGGPVEEHRFVTKQPIKRLLRYVKPYWQFAITGAAFMLIGLAIDLFMPIAIGVIFDEIVLARDVTRLLSVVGGLFILALVRAVNGYFQGILLGYLGQHATADLRKDLYDQGIGLSMRYYERTMSGDMLSRLANDTGLVQGMLGGQLLGLIEHPIRFIVALGIILVKDPTMTVVLLLVLPPVIGLGRIFGPRLQQVSRVVQEQLSSLTSFVQETLSGIAVVKSYNLSSYAQERFDRDNREVVDRTMDTVRLGSLFGGLMHFVMGLPNLMVLGVGGYRAIKGFITPGDVVSFTMYMQMIVGPVGWMTRLYTQYRQTLAGVDRIFEIIDATPEMREPSGEHTLSTLATDVELKKVWFAYEDEQWVLEDASFTLPTGKTTALVGASGAGKSTIAKLLCRFYDPQKGELTLSGRKFTELDLESVRDRVTYIPQESFLFGMSIRENLLLARPEATEAELEQACKDAAALGFITELPEGMDTIVGERGVRLSGGQRQRIAIARAILRNPELLVMDEATASLHTEAEKEVHDALKRLMVGRTSVIIAHRLSTIADADQLVVLDKGKVVEAGAPSELVALGGVFARMWKLQSLNIDVEELASRALKDEASTTAGAGL